MKFPTNARLWLRVGIVVVSCAVAWFLATLLLPERGWSTAGQVTGFGLVVVVGLIVLFLVLEARETKQADHDRTARRRKRRDRSS